MVKYFKTNSGNTYALDDSTGKVTQVKEPPFGAQAIRVDDNNLPPELQQGLQASQQGQNQTPTSPTQSNVPQYTPGDLNSMQSAYGQLQQTAKTPAVCWAERVKSREPVCKSASNK